MADKRADLAGPGISTYEEVEKILPTDYEPLLPPMRRTEAVLEVKRYIEDHLCKELGLKMVRVPLIVGRLPPGPLSSLLGVRRARARARGGPRRGRPRRGPSRGRFAAWKAEAATLRRSRLARVATIARWTISGA